MSYGFTFKEIHSSTYGIIAKSSDRPLMPELRKRKIIVPDRNGSFDYGGNKFSDRTITINIKYIAGSLSDLRAQSREIGAWLYTEQEEQLIFDDEPTKYYLARLYSQIGLTNFIKIGEANLVFECQPLARNVTTKTESFTVTNSGHTENIVNSGNYLTPVKITITNLGTNTINGFNFARKKID